MRRPARAASNGSTMHSRAITHHRFGSQPALDHSKDQRARRKRNVQQGADGHGCRRILKPEVPGQRVDVEVPVQVVDHR